MSAHIKIDEALEGLEHAASTSEQALGRSTNDR